MWTREYISVSSLNMSYSFDQSTRSIETHWNRCVVMPAVIHYRPYFMGIWGFNGSVLTTIRYLLKRSFLQNKNISVLAVILAYNRNIYMFWSVVSTANIFFDFVHAKLRTSWGCPKPRKIFRRLYQMIKEGTKRNNSEYVNRHCLGGTNNHCSTTSVQCVWYNVGVA